MKLISTLAVLALAFTVAPGQAAEPNTAPDTTRPSANRCDSKREAAEALSCLAQLHDDWVQYNNQQVHALRVRLNQLVREGKLDVADQNGGPSAGRILSAAQIYVRSTRSAQLAYCSTVPATARIGMAAAYGVRGCEVNTEKDITNRLEAFKESAEKLASL